MPIRFAALGPALIPTLLAASLASAQEPRADTRRDIHSSGNPHEIRVRHIDLDLHVDFDHKQLKGSATLTIERQPACPEGAALVLDTRDLTVEEVRAGRTDEGLANVPFDLGPADRILGQPLRIKVPSDARRVRVAYHTSPRASALQWLEPRQTASQRPFLFSQSEAIHARSWIPTQDSPGVRVTYTAAITTDQCRPVMSAEARKVAAGSGTGRAVRSFEMSQPIAPYLIALAVGDLEFQSLGQRTGVYAEPPVLPKAAHEFADTEKMVAAAEKRYGPYRWGRYDILILPPSFPFGGMENPRLTFATPTVLAGDRSLVSLVAHELAHSWSGNLVTNATWSDFWLNEGFTTYIERRIVEDLYGPDRAAMEAVLGLQELREELKTLPASDQILHIDLTGRDPDEGMTRVPYEKGALFLTTLEHAFGRERFDAFLRGYFDHFAFQSITTADFEAYLREHLFPADPKAAGSINVHAWLHEPGLPAGYPEPHSERFEALDRQAQAFSEGKLPAADLNAKRWSTQEWLHFLRALPDALSAARMAELDAADHLTDRGNAEIAQQWLLMAIRSGYKPADARLESFLTTIGRRKFLMPLYGELVKTPDGKARAQAIYAKARPFYHPIAADSVDRLLKSP